MRIMRTITELHRDRLLAEAEEADIEGLTKVAENLTRQIEKAPIRPEGAGYTYPHEDFEQDVQDSLWSVVVRTADFHGASIDSNKAQELVDFYTEELVSAIKSAGKITSKIGVYEPSVPGETRQIPVIEVEEEE